MEQGADLLEFVLCGAVAEEVADNDGEGEVLLDMQLGELGEDVLQFAVDVSDDDSGKVLVKYSEK